MDENKIVKEVTLKVTGTLDIGKALVETRGFLATIMPMDEIILLRMDETDLGLHLVIRVTGAGVTGEQNQFLFLLDESKQKLDEGRLVPGTPKPGVFFLSEISDEIKTLNAKQRFRDLGLPECSDVLVLFDYQLNAALVAISYLENAYDETHVRLFEMLREPFVIALNNALRYTEIQRIRDTLEEDNRDLWRDIQRDVGDRVIGMNRGLRQVMSLVSQVARTPSPVLLLGETGSGKEVVATAIHRFSDRGGGPFISLNCGAIPEPLIDSELFGHEKGAFTGANERKRGRFERADKGTLFLDEVGELPLSAQVRLLRVLQEKEFERIGGNQVIRADVRLIAATNRDLPAMVKDGRFREDLWFRLNVFPIEIPPLRERREDIPALAYHFIETKCRQLNLSFRPALPSESLAQLVSYDWPGNVRELQNAIERALILSRGEPLRFPHLVAAETAGRPVSEPPDTSIAIRMPTFDEVVTEYLKSLLASTNGRIAGPRGAARIAGINPSTLRSKLKKMGIKSP